MSAGFEVPDRLLVAIGGNATHPENIAGTSDEQRVLAAAPGTSLVPLAPTLPSGS